MQSNLGDVDAINDNLSASCLDDSEQRQRERGLSGSCSAHNSDLLLTIHDKRDAFEDELETITIAHLEILELNNALLRPALILDKNMNLLIE